MTSTAVTTPDREDGVGQLPEAIRQQIRLRKLENVVRAEMAKLSWGAALDRQALGAIAEWGRVYNVDVTQEIDLLGGRVYLNARYYLRRLADLVEGGRVEYAYADHIHDDPRLKDLGAEGDAERLRRLKERVRYNVPEKAAAVVAFRVKVREMDQEIVGVNWAGGGVRAKDPVGDTEPVKTAESRAARRAMRQLVGHVPGVEDAEAVVETLAPVEAEIQRARTLDRAERARPRLPVYVPDVADPFAETTQAPPVPTLEVKAEVIDMAAKPTKSTLFHGEPDVYQAEPGDARD